MSAINVFSGFNAVQEQLKNMYESVTSRLCSIANTTVSYIIAVPLAAGLVASQNKLEDVRNQITVLQGKTELNDATLIEWLNEGRAPREATPEEKKVFGLAKTAQEIEGCVYALESDALKISGHFRGTFSRTHLTFYRFN